MSSENDSYNSVYLIISSYLQIHQTHEARLAAAEDLRKAAEHEKLDKEESARNLLAQQEEIMENVVQESRLIAQAAEENSKVATYLTND